MILLDTHLLIWAATGERGAGPRTKRLVDEARALGDACVSAFSFWELGTLIAKGRLGLDGGADGLRRSALSEGLREIPLDGEVAIASTAVRGIHGDPADRIIVATALSIGATLVTADKAILRWKGPLRTFDARR